MPDEPISPVAVVEPLTAEPTTTPETPASTPAAPEATKATEPDIDSLLSNEDFINKILNHPKALHRIKSEAGRTKADIERLANERAAETVRQVEERARQAEERTRADAARRTQIGAEEQQDQRWQRMVEEDPTSPWAQEMRPVLESRRQTRDAEKARQRVIEEVLPQLMPALERQSADKAGKYWLDMLAGQIQADESLTDEEKGELDPRNPKFKTPGEFFQAWVKASSSNIAKKMAKELAKVETEARVQEALGKDREKQPTAATLPEGGTVSVEGLFADYASGKSNDHGRALKTLRDMGLQI